MPDAVSFARYATLYDLVYSGKDTQAEVNFVLGELESHGVRSGARILELGSGTGRHARLIAASGHEIVGVESSKEMIQLAEPIAGFSFLQGDARTVRLDQSFDAVLSLFHVLSYQTSQKDVRDFFSTARAHLAPGGLFGFDVWYSPAVHAIRPESRTLFKENDAVSLVRQAYPEEDLEKSLVTVNYDFCITDKASGSENHFVERHVMRHFSHNEIVRNATDLGFELLGSCEFLTGNAPSRETWGVWFMLRVM